MNTNQRISMLRDAQVLIAKAVELIDDAVGGTPSAKRAEDYLIPALEMSAFSAHIWLGGNSANIDNLIIELREGDTPEPDEDESDAYNPFAKVRRPDWVCNKVPFACTHLLMQGRAIDFVKAWRRVYECDLSEAINTRKHYQAHEGI